MEILKKRRKFEQDMEAEAKSGGPTPKIDRIVELLQQRNRLNAQLMKKKKK